MPPEYARLGDPPGPIPRHLEDTDVQPRTEAKPDPAPTPEESWIGQNEGWL